MDQIATATPQDKPIATEGGLIKPPTPPLDYDTAEDRAQKAAWSLGLAPDAVRDQIMAGAEDDLRKHISAAWDRQTDDKFNQKLYEFSQNSAWAPTVDDIVRLKQETLQEKEFNNPKGIFEWATANKYLNTLYGSQFSIQSPIFTEYLRNKPDEAQAVSYVGRNFLAQDGYLDTQIKNLSAKVQEQSIFERGAHALIESIPPVESLILRGNIPGVPFLAGGIGEGSHMEQSRLALRRVPYPEFVKAVDQAVNYMVEVEHSPQMAIKFLQYMKGALSPFESDVGTAVNIATGATASGTVKILARTISSLAKVPGRMVEVYANSAVGNINKAAEASAAQALKDTPVERVSNGIVDGFNTMRKTIEGGPSDNFVELRNRTLEEHDAQVSKVVQTMTDAVKIDAIGKALKSPEGLQVLRQQSAGKYGDERVLNVGEPWMEPFTGSYWWETRLGTPKGTYYDSDVGARAAANWMGLRPKGVENTERALELQRIIESTTGAVESLRKLGSTGGFETLHQQWKDAVEELHKLRQIPGVDIKNDGLGWYISSWNSLDKDAKVIKDLAIGTDISKSPQSNLTDWMSALRTPGSTFSQSLFNAARIVSYAPGLFRKLAIDDLKVAKALRGWPGTEKREMYNQLEQAIRETRQLRNETGDMGKIYGLSELHDYYNRTFDRSPSDREVSAYYSWARFEGLNDALLRLQKLRNEANLGAKQYRIRSIDEGGNIVYSKWFTGVDTKAMPRGSETAMYATRVAGREVMRPAFGFKTGRVGARLSDNINNGVLRSVKVLYPHENPLLGYGRLDNPNINITHVIGNLESKELEVTPREFRAWEYDAPYSVKQAIKQTDPVSGITYYKGDRTVVHAPKRAAGKQFVEQLNIVRDLLKNNKELEAINVAQKLGVPWSEIKGWFDSGHLVKDEPIRLVPKDKRIADIDNSLKFDTENFKDATLSPHFRGEPDKYEIHQIQNEGSKTKPLWEYTPSPKLTPTAVINRSFQGIVNSTYLSEFKNMAINQWIRDAKPYLNARYKEEIDHSPYHFFYNGQLSHADWPTYSRLEGNRMKIKQILGTPDQLDTGVHQIGQALYDRAYEGGLNKAFLIPAWAVDKYPQWSQALRTYAYHAVFSWNPVQIMVQSMNYATIAGLSGYRNAGIGSAAGFFHHFAKRNENWVPGIGAMLEVFGWRPGEFEEAYHALKRTGFQYVGKEQIINEGLQAPLISNGAQNFFDKSSMFFNTAERNQRYAAWYTAWKEHRDKFPTGAISNEDLGTILGRADTLTGEMTSASKSMIQRGPLAFTTQFQTYSLRMLELMFSNRISNAARARTLATYALLFGVPATASLGSGLTYFSNKLREEAIKRNYIPGESFLSTAWNEGIPSYLASLATGKVYNVGSRYASFGFDLEGDKGFWEIAGGAAGGMFKEALDLKNPLIKSMQDMVNEDPKSAWAPTIASLNTALKRWSVYNAPTRLWTALTTRDWVSRKGYALERDMTPKDAIAQTLLGLQSQDIADFRANQNILDGRRQAVDAVRKQVREEYQNYDAADRANDQAAKDASLKNIFNAVTTGGLPVEDRARVLGEAARSAQETLPESQQRKLGTQNLPPDESGDVFRERYIRRQELKGKK